MYSKILKASFSQITLPANQNQARLLGEYSIDFLKNGNPSAKVQERVKLFHTDSVLCGLSALALKTNAPTVLRYNFIQWKKEMKRLHKHLGYLKPHLILVMLECLDQKIWCQLPQRYAQTRRQ